MMVLYKGESRREFSLLSWSFGYELEAGLKIVDKEVKIIVW